MVKEPWEKFGISVPPDLADEIEEPLAYGDSRSERVRRLLRAGLAAEQGPEGRRGKKDERGLLYGVRLTPEQAERVEAPLQEEESRSKRIRELVEVGLTAEHAALAYRGDQDSEA